MVKKVEKRRKSINEQEFSRIKALLDAQVRPSLVAQVTGRSLPTISRMQGVDDYAGYKAVLRTTNISYKRNEAKRLAEAQAITEPERSHIVHGTVGEPTTQGSEQPESSAHPEIVPTDQAVLTRIAEAIERLADAWEAEPKRKFFK